jgi:carboxymethylenebutenolidase
MGSRWGRIIVFHRAPARSRWSSCFIGAERATTPATSSKTYALKLADAGYYTESIEYYSQTEALFTGDNDGIVRGLPTWLSEVHTGIAALKKNQSVNPNKVGLMGFSLGAYIALAYGATYPEGIAAIVEYYGRLMPGLYAGAATMPPVLILQGSSDRIVPRSEATDLDEVLTKAGRPHEMKIYVGVRHGFNIPGTMNIYNQAAADDAWDRSLKFLDTHLKSDSK